MPPGVWTVCYHHNSWMTDQMACFEHELERFAPRIIGLAQVLANWSERPLSWGDRITAWRHSGMEPSYPPDAGAASPSKTPVMRVLFLSRCLGNGGAERQLTELVRAIDNDRFGVTVATFYPGVCVGGMWRQLRTFVLYHWKSGTAGI